MRVSRVTDTSRCWDRPLGSRELAFLIRQIHEYIEAMELPPASLQFVRLQLRTRRARWD
jgi:hypothetical protein